MFNVVSLLSVALVASSVSGAVLPRRHSGLVPRRLTPEGWLTDYLEPYQTYHTRYLALSCQNFHGQPFFDLCCHPLLATETLEANRDASCVPSPSASTSAFLAEPTSNVPTPDDCDGEDNNEADDGDDEDCEDDDEPTTVASSSAAAVTTTAAPVAAAPAPEATTSKAEETSSKDEPTTSKAEPTTSKAEPTTTKAEPTTTKKSSSAEPSPTGGSTSGTFSGDGTFFTQNGVAGACGTVHADSDAVVAMDSRLYGNTGLKSALCGKHVKITNTKNGKSVTALVADACPTCNTKNSIDMSIGAFTQIATEEEGLVPIKWSFV